MKTSILPRAAVVLLVISTAAAQTLRTMILAAPAAPGQTMEIVVVYPPAAGGNLNVLLWSNPFPGVSTPVIPGLTLNGQARVDPVNFFSTSLVVFDPVFDRRHVPIGIPANSAFLGTRFDTQSLGPARGDGLVWSIGNGFTSVSQTNVRVEWAALGSSSIVRLTPPYPTATLVQVVGNH